MRECISLKYEHLRRKILKTEHEGRRYVKLVAWRDFSAPWKYDCPLLSVQKWTKKIPSHSRGGGLQNYKHYFGGWVPSVYQVWVGLLWEAHLTTFVRREGKFGASKGQALGRCCQTNRGTSLAKLVIALVYLLFLIWRGVHCSYHFHLAYYRSLKSPF